MSDSYGEKRQTLAETYFTQPAPARKMPEDGAPATAALRMLQAEMMLDGDPNKNLATFVTTYMEPEARQVISENLHRNYIDHAEYPRTSEVMKRCVRMIHDLFNGPGDPETPGTATVGSSEAVMLGGLAMKWRWKEARQKEGKSDASPNMVYGGDVHVVWDKFCRYFDVEPRKVDIPVGKTTVGPEELGPQIDENTIGIVGVAGTTFTGECDDLEGLDRMLGQIKQEKGLDIPMHVDAASGGFVFPFSHPDFKWDFRLESVKSINTSGHKFGLVYPGVGWLIMRDDEQIPEGIIFYEDYLGQKDSTFTLNFSASASFILAQYYMFLREGRSGYTSLVKAMNSNRDAISDRLEQIDALEVLKSERPTLPLLIARVRDGEGFTGADLVGDLKRRNAWLVPAYKMPPKNEDQEIVRMLIKINQTRELADALCDDFEAAVSFLREKAAAGALAGPKPHVHTGHGY